MSAEREKDEELISTGPARPAQNWRQRFSSTLKVLGGKVGRKQMVLGIFLMCMQQLSGVDGVLFVCVHRSTSQQPILSLYPIS